MFDDMTTDELHQLIVDANAALFQRRIAARQRRSMATLIHQIAAEAGVSVEELRGRDRRYMLAKYRAQFVRAAHAAGHSYPAIGRFLDGRDHSTVMHLGRPRAGRYCYLEAA